jgi:DNA-binding transcriptional MerR regulator
LRIGELAELTGASRRSLRYYESRGLLTSARTSGGHRVFDPDAVGRVARIREMLVAGFSIAEIGELLPCLLAPPSRRTGLLSERLFAHRRRLEDAAAHIAQAHRALDGLTEGLRAQQQSPEAGPQSLRPDDREVRLESEAGRDPAVHDHDPVGSW